MQYILAELNQDGSLDERERLIIQGRVTVRTIESLLRKFLKDYVLCEMCKSLLTKLSRDAVSRLSFVQCEVSSL